MKDANIIQAIIIVATMTVAFVGANFIHPAFVIVFFIGVCIVVGYRIIDPENDER